MLLFTVVIAVSNACYTKYAKRQWRVMKDQLGQMESSGRQTDQMLCLVRQQLEQITKQTGYTNEMATQAKLQAEAATNTVKTMQEQFLELHRPSISVMDFAIADWNTRKVVSDRPGYGFVIGEPLVVNVTVKNIGGSEAVNVIFHTHMVIGDDLPKVEAPDADSKQGDTIDIGAGRMTTVVSIKDTYSRESVVLNPADVINWDGTIPVIVFGRISYSDRQEHKFCTPYMVSRTDTGNWMYVNDLKKGTKRITTKELCPIGKR